LRLLASRLASVRKNDRALSRASRSASYDIRIQSESRPCHEVGSGSPTRNRFTTAIHSTPKVIPGLDAVRAAAVSMVVFMHFGYLPTTFGELGVMTFFVLSGFLITRILFKEYLKTGTISLRELYRRRTMRIFPTFYVCWLLEMLLIVIHRERIPGSRWPHFSI
jgi:hypothetical protein